VVKEQKSSSPIELTCPTEAIGLYGNRRKVTKIAFSMDREKEFWEVLSRDRDPIKAPSQKV
jgi:hypothetical protein